MRAPAFAAHYPSDPELRVLVDLFEQGNYRAVRDGVDALLAADASEDVKTAARDLRTRTGPDRVQLLLLAIAAIFVVVLSVYEVTQHHAR